MAVSIIRVGDGRRLKVAVGKSEVGGEGGNLGETRDLRRVSERTVVWRKREI